MNRHERRATQKSDPVIQRRPSKGTQPPLVALCMPSGSEIKADTAFAMLTCGIFSAKFVNMAPINWKNTYLSFGRNDITKFALEINADWLMWWDHDNTFPPETLVELLQHDKDIVGCDYRKRLAPFDRIGKFVGDDPGENGAGLHEMTLLPHGVLLVRASVYKRLAFPWYVVDHSIHQDRPQTGPFPVYGTGEDNYFCREARKAGFQIWCDMDLTKRVCHIGERVVSYVRGGGAQ